ncbi:MAG: hypothetical protein PXX73_04625 [Sideroxydans sp.]|nr:hypothetical protein [Sideroxydans sp.]
MKIEVEFVWLVGLLLSFFGVVWVFGMLLVSQFEKRIGAQFEAQGEARKVTQFHWDTRFNELDALAKRTAADVMALRIELPKEYIAREDWIRLSVSIDNKIDAIHKMVNEVKEKLYARN